MLSGVDTGMQWSYAKQSELFGGSGDTDEETSPEHVTPHCDMSAGAPSTGAGTTLFLESNHRGSTVNPTM